MITLPNFNQYIKEKAREHGFALCGVSKAEAVEEQCFLDEWIAQGRNAGMDWFFRNRELRMNPALLVENGQTVISFAYAYSPLKEHNVAAYANAVDYHFTLKEKLTKIIEEINIDYGVTITARAFTDSAPLMERYWARKSGLGWIGKSGMLINRTLGSYLLLCEIVCDVVSDVYDCEDSFDGCGRCRRCIKQCPTGAIGSDKRIDARKCISYLTIEHRGDFSEEQLAMIRNSRWVYGCDTCLECCPWNKRSASLPAVFVENDLLEMANSTFKEKYKNTPLERSGLKTIRRNYVGKLF